MQWFTDLSGGFGITRLAEAFTLDSQRLVDGGVLGVVTAWRADDTVEQAAAARQDCAALLGSPLTDDQIGLLWSGATGGMDRLERRATGGREWLAQVDAALAERSTHPVRMPDATGEAAAIREAIRSLGPDLDAHIAASLVPSAGAIAPALGRCAEAASPELAFRLLVATVLRYWFPLPRAEYANLVAIGERLAYAPFLVESVEFLTR